MFRLQNNVPAVYVNESRDFQLLCRLYDFLFNSAKYDINSITSILDSMYINDRMLPLLCTKLGFFTEKQFDSKTLRYILNAFPKIMKYKGCKKGIELAVTTILKLEGDYSVPIIEYERDSQYKQLYNINIYTSIINPESKQALSEILKYVLPLGFTYQLHPSYKTSDTSGTSNIRVSNNGASMKNSTPVISSVFNSIPGATDNLNNLEKHMVNNYNSTYFSTEVVSIDDIKDSSPISSNNMISKNLKVSELKDGGSNE